MTRRPPIIRVTAPLLAALLATSGAFFPLQAQTVSEDADTAAAYCTNLSDAAADARFVRKLARLKEAEEKVNERLRALEVKRAEYEEWLERRQEFLAVAHENLVSIYSGMRPEAASEQLAAMSEVTAAAVIARVTPRTASAILNEMPADKAARLATIMAGMTRTGEQNG